MPQTLPTTPLPSESSDKTVVSKTYSLQFGNGYTQDNVDGINNKVDSWNLVYENISSTDFAALTAILDAAGSWDIINWTEPGGTAKRYKMDKAGYTEKRVALLYTLSFKLNQYP